MRLIITVALLVVGSSASAVPWPILGDPRIEQCSNRSGTSGSCSSAVYYSTSGSVMVDVNAVGSPLGGMLGTRVEALGVHCTYGNAMEGNLPFRDCRWSPADGHAPKTVGKCELRGSNSWELTSDSTCSVASTWGSHTGAGPGGECVIFTNYSWVQSPKGAVATTWGMVTAEQAANSGNRFCSKPLPPNVQCELKLPSLIDHGTLVAGGSSKREDDGKIDCGRTPKIDVLVNGDRNTGGVRITARAVVVNASTVRIASEIRVSQSAVPGEHRATYVFVVSPY
jgi:hypothetical protein